MEDTLENGTAKIPLSEDYKEMGTILAKERIVQAGYRLAAVIEDVDTSTSDSENNKRFHRVISQPLTR